MTAARALFPASLPVLSAMRRTAGGRAWLAGLPALVEELRTDWGLRFGAPYHGGSCSWVAPALQPDGTRAVFKVTWPHQEARPEGDVLRLWDGQGAVRVYAHDPDRWALLLEPCEPGTRLGLAHHIPARDRLLAGAEVLRELWAASEPKGDGEDVEGSSCPSGPSCPPGASCPPGPSCPSGPSGRPGPPHGTAPPGGPLPSCVELLADVAAGWAGLLEERAAARHGRLAEHDVGLCRLASDLLRELPRTARRLTVLHGDFNPGNLLAAAREPWLAIDTKPLYGDPAFDPWPLIEQLDAPFAHPDPHRVLTDRTALVADVLGEDPDRLRAWAFTRRVEYALWSAEGAEAADGTEGLEGAEDVAEVEESAQADVPGPDRQTGEPSPQRLLREARVLAEVASL